MTNDVYLSRICSFNKPHYFLKLDGSIEMYSMHALFLTKAIAIIADCVFGRPWERK